VGVAQAFDILEKKESEFNSLVPSDPHPGPPHKGEGEENECEVAATINTPVPLV
jgi:hypothetical protein